MVLEYQMVHTYHGTYVSTLVRYTCTMVYVYVPTCPPRCTIAILECGCNHLVSAGCVVGSSCPLPLAFGIVMSQLSDWKRAHMCTENHICFGRIHGSQLREGANAGQHTPTLSQPPSHHCLNGEVYCGNRHYKARACITPLSATSWVDGPLKCPWVRESAGRDPSLGPP
jgi:hypothetical protein